MTGKLYGALRQVYRKVEIFKVFYFSGDSSVCNVFYNSNLPMHTCRMASDYPETAKHFLVSSFACLVVTRSC